MKTAIMRTTTTGKKQFLISEFFNDFHTFFHREYLHELLEAGWFRRMGSEENLKQWHICSFVRLCK